MQTDVFLLARQKGQAVIAGVVVLVVVPVLHELSIHVTYVNLPMQVYIETYAFKQYASRTVDYIFGIIIVVLLLIIIIMMIIIITEPSEP